MKSFMFKFVRVFGRLAYEVSRDALTNILLDRIDGIIIGPIDVDEMMHLSL